MAGGRQGVAAGGALRQGGGAHARSSRVCAPVPPPPPQSLHGAVRCGALPSSALLCTALLQSLHRAAPPPLSLHHAAFFPSLHAPLPPPAFSGCRALLRSSPPVAAWHWPSFKSVHCFQVTRWHLQITAMPSSAPARRSFLQARHRRTPPSTAPPVKPRIVSPLPLLLYTAQHCTFLQLRQLQILRSLQPRHCTTPPS